MSFDENQQKPVRNPPVAERNSLEIAVADFNARAGKDRTGKFEPALTSDEVVAAIRGWNRKQIPVDDETYKIFEDIAASSQMPKRSKLSFSTGSEQNGIRFQVWRISLDVMTGENTGYTFRIRERTISSRKLKY